MSVPAVAVVVALAAAVWLAILPYAVTAMLLRLGMVHPNFRGERIPVGFGLSIFFWSAPALAFAAFRGTGGSHAHAFLIVVAGMGILGFLDDWRGDRSATGLRGHFRKLAEGRVTTGLIKAIGGAAVGAAGAWWALRGDWPQALLDGAVIALFANAVNLLDLRPGRAASVFLILALILIALQLISPNPAPPLLVLVVIPSLAAYWPDSRARVMLGDTGSNLLGGALGLAIVLEWRSLAARIGVLAALTAFHVFTERVSLSGLIERNPLLKRFDGWTGVR